MERADTELAATLWATGPEVSFIHPSVYGDAAVVEFDWDFVATRRDNGQRLSPPAAKTRSTSGDQGWRLVHLHYSGPPVTGAGQGSDPLYRHRLRRSAV